jgi:ATP-dependent Clp protease adaptor protein ClpS
MSTETNVIEKVEQNFELKQPKMYKVLLHNDNTTTMDFVMMVLMSIFHKTAQEAIEITLSIHHNGQGIAGSPYTAEVAEEKTIETVSLARANGYPLTATFEEL